MQGIVPKLEALNKLSPRLAELDVLLSRVEELEKGFPAIGSITEKINTIEKTLISLKAMDSQVINFDLFSPKLSAIEDALQRLLEADRKVPYVENFMPKIEAVERILIGLTDIDKKMHEFNEFKEKLATLEATYLKLEEVERRMPQTSVFDSVMDRLEKMNNAMSKIERIERIPVPVSSANGEINDVATALSKHDEKIHEWNRLKLLSRFVKFADKAKEIEQEWVTIQQDANNSNFAFQSGRGVEVDVSYKKGIVDGIKWCVNRFS